MPRFLKRSISRSRGPMQVSDYTVNRFLGLVTSVADPKEVQKGVAVDALNWLTGGENDHIELRPGMQLLGTRQSGAGKITGMGVGVQNNGTQRLFFTHSRKAKYLDYDANSVTEIGSNLLPAAADGEDITMDYYNNIAGAFMYMSSPNSSIYKIPVANPGSAVDQLSTTFKGKIRIKQNRTFLHDNKVTSTGFTDKTGLFTSYIDKSLFSQYTSVSAESLGGSGTHRTGTLAAKGGGSKRTAFGVVIVDSGGTEETFLDDKNGNLVSNLGSTGTINYATMAYDVTFAANPSGTVQANYQWEDSTSQGICDFSHSSPRTAGQGNYFRQDDGGGNLMTVMTFNLKEYCLHLLKTWVVNTPADDTESTNLIYRNRVGVPYFLAAAETGDGVVYLDYSDKNNPQIRRLQIGNSQNPASTEVLPEDLSEALNLNPYAFDYAVVFEYGNYYLLCCQEKVNGVANSFNSVMFAYHKEARAWDKLDYYVSRLAIVDGKLIGGDSVTNNIFELFSGVDEDDSVIDNYWISGQMNLGVEGRKRVFRFAIDGYINTSQKLKIYLSFDGGEFIQIKKNADDVYTIEGNGPYVDANNGTMIGSSTVGTDVIGSSGSSNAFHFAREFTIATDIFEHVQFKVVATDVGAVQINNFTFKDIRFKGRKKVNTYLQ